MNTLIQARSRLLVAASLGAASLGAHAQLVINDTLNSTSSTYSWAALNGACLTAGDATTTGSIPACVGLNYYKGQTQVGGTSGRLPDISPHGALRLTNGDYQAGTNGNNQTGSVVSNFTFPSNEGISVTWTSVSYGGNAYGTTGADGIAFFLSDGAYAPSIGAFGGSLGYSCSNGKNPSDGVIGGYLGIGIDEFGNFPNSGDNTNTGPGFKAGRITIRGAGFTAWNWLSTNAAYSKYYTGSPNATAIQNSCSTGYAWNYSGVDQTDSKGNTIHNGKQTGDKLPLNYPWLFSSDVNGNAKLADGTSVTLANQEAVNMPTRGQANIFIFALKITADGLLDFSYSVAGPGAASAGATINVVSGYNITASNGALPKTFRFGFSSGTGGGSNVHEITCFKAQPANVSNSSAGTNVQQGQLVPGGEQVFLAYYHPVNWWGQLTANTLRIDTDTNGNSTLVAVGGGSTAVGDHSVWDANCVLTGGACLATSADTKNPVNVSVQDPTTRKILTWNNSAPGSGGKGIPFKVLGTLSSAQQTAIGGSQTEIDYLRGVRTNEALNQPAGTAGVMRNRTSVLGDIVDSSPLWVGAPSFSYANSWVDKLKTTGSAQPEGTSYAAFQTAKAGRSNVVYVGSNDGLLHGFNAGVLTVTGNTSTVTNSNGTELIAYMPGQVVNAIHPYQLTSLGTYALDTSGNKILNTIYDYSNTSYHHNFEVDATPGMGDLYYGTSTTPANNWHTWLAAGIGVGGHNNGPVNSNTAAIPGPDGALFILDITNPDSFADDSTSAKNTVIGEWTSATISCTGNATCGTNFGQITGTPLIRRLHDGTWGVIFGNGINSATGRAGLFIIHVDSTGGTSAVQYIDTGTLGAGPGNGIVAVSSADLDGDHIADYVYAGDLKGNLWRFDLTASTSASWGLSTAVTPVFTAASGQPITTAPVISAVAAGNASGLPKVVISFGTGQKLPMTDTQGEIFATGTQSLYGVWDANMSTWNSSNTDTKYDSLTSTGQPIGAVSTASYTSPLVVQTITQAANGNRTLTSNTICWQGSGAGCTDLGWRVDLPTTGEQSIYDPVQIEDTFIINTTIPASAQPLSCDSQPPTGYTMALDLVTGGGSNAPFTDSSGNVYSGVPGNAAGTVGEYTYNGTTYIGSGTNDGKWKSQTYNRRGGTVSKVTWTKVR